MSFPTYPKFKDSGVQWVAKIPEHWEAASLRWLTRRYSGGTPDKANLGYWTDGTIPWLNSGAVNLRLIDEPSAYITVDAFEHSSAKWVPAGALVMALAGQGKTKGMVAQLAIPSTCNQSMAAIVPTAQVEARFLFWWLTSNYENIRNLAGGDLRDGLNLDLIGNIGCPLPPANEQSTIAHFLDEETTKIDELVATQNRLTGLLQEKRRAIIAHAVTKGLNPDAPMKPSGVVWFGDIPEHWDVVRIKSLLQDVKAGPFGSALTKDVYVDAGYRVFGQEQVIPNDFGVGAYYISEEKYRELHQYRVLPGDILISCVGTFGRVAVAPADIAPGIINPRLIRLRCSSSIDREYFAEVLRSDVTFEQFAMLSRGGTMDVISVGTLSEIMVAVPPREEQVRLLEFLRGEMTKVDVLNIEAERAIGLWVERRAAVISAAVTGKIDVRGLGKLEVA